MDTTIDKQLDILIDLYFNQPKILYQHLFASYHQFVEEIIPYSLLIEQNYFYENVDKEKIYLHGFKCSNIRIKPSIFENDNEIKFPSDARKNHLNYFATVVADIQQFVEIVDSLTCEKVIKNVGNSEKDLPIANIPIMIKSKYCSTHIKQNLKGECKYDPGGYFIVNGQEKIVMSIEKMVDNKILVFSKRDNSYPDGLIYTAQINSKKNDWSDNLQILTIKNRKDGILTVSTSSQLVDIPIFILMRALGIESDRDIISYITYNLEDDKMLNLLRPSVANSIDEFGNVIKTKNEAIEYLINKLKRNKRISQSNEELAKIQKKMYLTKILRDDLLPHLDKDIPKKIVFLGLMVNKLLNVILDRSDVDDRDALQNKRIEHPGVLLGQLFRQNWKKLLNEIGKHFKKKNLSDETPIVVVGQIKSSTVEQGIKTALSTGVWGMNRTKKGVAQSLQRLSWQQGTSYNRRILSPSMEDSTAKVTSIRQVNPNQCQLLCCGETPEGAKIGIVKSLSMMASITVQNSSQYDVLNNILKQNKHIKHPYDIDPLTMNTWVKIFLCGNFMGVCKICYANDIYIMLKKSRYDNLIDKYTSILFDYSNKEIRMYYDGGRLIRPLLIVNNNKLNITEEVNNDINIESNLNDKSKSWKKILDKYSNLIEYEDIESLNYLLVAENHNRLSESIEASTKKIESTDISKINRYGDYRWVNYTHCDFHSWVMLGTIIANIPFSNHNYANRNIIHFSQAKQSVGIYLSSYKDRMDISQILYNPQIPLVTTQAMKYNGSLDLPNGENIIVAIMSYTGYNQEDSIIFNQSAIDRGLFRADTIKKYHSEILKNPSTSQDDIFTKPDRNKVTSMKQGNYDKLNENGYVPEETIINDEDIIIGKISPIQPTGNNNKVYKDNSIIFKSNLPGVIDRVHTGIYNAEGYEMYNVKVRTERVPIIGDKFTCYDDSHEVLTSDGWINIKDVTLKNKVASLVDNKLVYQYPDEIQSYDYEGNMYLVESNQVSLCVTPNHRMWVSKRDKKYKVELAKNILHQRRHYKKNVEDIIVERNDEYLKYDEENNITHFKIDDLEFDIEDWIMFFGIWIAEGCLHNNCNYVVIAAHKQRIKDKLNDIAGRLQWTYNQQRDHCNAIEKDIWNLCNKQIYKYLLPYSVGAVNKYLPEWVWNLTPKLCRNLIDGMMLGDGHTMDNGTRRYDTSSTKLADDFQRLCLHSGYATNKSIKYKAGHKTDVKSGKSKGTSIISTCDAYRMTIIETQVEPIVNKTIKINKDTVENNNDSMIQFNGKVYCCSVKGDGIIYVRRNGITCFSGQSRHGQKGTVGITYKQLDMPFTESGIIPDIIINPHGYPTRMSVGHFIECLAAKEAAESGHFVDGTPFNNYDVKQLPEALKKLGFSPHGTEIMYCGLTGRKMDVEIFIGPLYEIRLKHNVLDKVHGRARGPRQALTRQPLEGRSRDGGLKIGEMEKDAMVAHGTAQFLKERLMETSDISKVYICDDCGMFASKAPDKEYYKCKGCHNSTRISPTIMPHACKLLCQELTSVNILPRIRTEKVIYGDVITS